MVNFYPITISINSTTRSFHQCDCKTAQKSNNQALLKQALLCNSNLEYSLPAFNALQFSCSLKKLCIPMEN